MSNTLLDRLVQETGVNFMSDLHSQTYAQGVYYAVCALSPREYSLQEWEETVEYILRKNKCNFMDVIGAHQFLCKSLKNLLPQK